MSFFEQRTIIIVSYVLIVVLHWLTVLNWFIELFPEEIAGFRAPVSSVSAVSLVMAWWYFYFKKGWKLWLLNRLLFRNDLSGTWFGNYKSHDLKTGEITSGDIAIRIVQDYLSTSFISYTEKYRNYSYREEVKHDRRSKICRVVYSYSQVENGIFDTVHRKGTSELTLAKKTDNSEDWLEGVFWTIHGTQGSICVKRVSRKHIDFFDEAKDASETRGRN